MIQTVIEWESKYDYSGHDDLKHKLNQLIEDGFSIVQVIPSEYIGSEVSRIVNALIIVTGPEYGKA